MSLTCLYLNYHITWTKRMTVTVRHPVVIYVFHGALVFFMFHSSYEYKEKAEQEPWPDCGSPSLHFLMRNCWLWDNNIRLFLPSVPYLDFYPGISLDYILIIKKTHHNVLGTALNCRNKCPSLNKLQSADLVMIIHHQIIQTEELKLCAQNLLNKM